MRSRELGCLPPTIRPARRSWLRGFARIIQDEPRVHSEAIAPFFEDEGDPLDTIATEYNLSNITKRDVQDARKELRRATQRSLRERGIPARVTVYRYGALRRAAWKPDITSVTLDPGVAARGGNPTDPVYVCEISRDRVLVDVPAILRTDLLEEELLVRPGDLVCRETSRKRLQTSSKTFCIEGQGRSKRHR